MLLLPPEFGSINASALAEIWLICLLHAISNDHFQIALCSSHEQDCVESAARWEVWLVLTLMNIISDVLSVPWWPGLGSSEA